MAAPLLFSLVSGEELVMRLQRLSVGLAAAALTLSLASAWAQDERGRPQQSEPSRPSNGDNVGSAAPRGGGDSGSAASTAGSTSSGGGASSNSGGSNTSWMGNAPSGYSAPRAPVHPDRDRAARAEAADQRHNPGSSSSGRAVPRGESGGGKASGSTGSTSASAGSESQPTQGRSRAVPENSRPRDGRTQTGTAVARTYPPSTGGGGYSYYPSYVYDPFYSFYYSPYYSRYSYWSPYGYGYGLGYFSYDPFLFGGLGYPGYYGGGYAGGYPESSGGGGYVQQYRGAGSLRLKVKPANAQVYIDGYYVGVIDSFDGAFQRLNVEAGPHHVELRAEGYETTAFEVVVTPGDTVTYKGEMKRR
jgi:hypothetical protein